MNGIAAISTSGEMLRNLFGVRDRPAFVLPPDSVECQVLYAQCILRGMTNAMDIHDLPTNREQNSVNDASSSTDDEFAKIDICVEIVFRLRIVAGVRCEFLHHPQHLGVPSRFRPTVSATEPFSDTTDIGLCTWQQNHSPRHRLLPRFE